MLFGVPIRLVVYGLAYGLDLFGLPLIHSISAETTPLGTWQVRLVDFPDSERRQMAHGIYVLEEVQQILAEWAESSLHLPRSTASWGRRR